MSSTAKRVFRIVAWIPVGILFVDHGFSIATVTGRSMQPTFNPDSSELVKDIVLLNRTITWKADLGARGWKVGDVVTLYSPYDSRTLLTKRIIGLPGALVRTLPPCAERYVRVPAGHCWVEGDERFHTRDSNTFGAVPLGLLTARVDYVLWPLNRFGNVPVRAAEKESRVVHPRVGFA